jgi:hypothetical protein
MTKLSLMAERDIMIYSNQEEPEDSEEKDPAPETFTDEEGEPLIGLVGEITEETTQQVALNILSKNTDEYFSAEEALEMGLVDKII